MIGVFTQTDIGNDRQTRNLTLDGADRLLNDAGVGIGVAANSILGLGNTKKQHGRDAQCMDLFGLCHDMLDGLLPNTRHGGYLFPDTAPEC